MCSKNAMYMCDRNVDYVRSKKKKNAPFTFLMLVISNP